MILVHPHHSEMADSGTETLGLVDTFHQAADHLAAMVTSDASSVSDAVKLQLYGLYKQATVGPCSTPKPAFWDRAGRSKWNAWSRLGDLSQQTAMQQYIDTLSQQDPHWQQAAAAEVAAAFGDSNSSRAAPQGQKGGVGGPVFSTLACSQQQQASGSSSSSIHELAGQGNLAAVQACLDSGTAIDSRDDQDCTALHFAADRGQEDAIKLLLTAGADMNAQDVDGQTALHYAALCGHQSVCALLLAGGADSSIQDSDGQTAQQIAPEGWTCWKQ